MFEETSWESPVLSHKAFNKFSPLNPVSVSESMSGALGATEEQNQYDSLPTALLKHLLHSNMQHVCNLQMSTCAEFCSCMMSLMRHIDYTQQYNT